MLTSRYVFVLSSIISVLSRLVDVRNTKLCLGTQSCGIRVSPRTHHVSHGNRGPWNHLLARGGFVELVPVVVHFPKLMWLLAFSVTLAPVRVKKNGLVVVRFQRCLHVPHDSCGPLKHLLARRGYVELVPVMCILNRMV